MSDSIPIKPSPEEVEATERQFRVRRPMLTHVARAMKSEVEELLKDKELAAQVSQAVLTGEQFTQLATTSAFQSPLIEITSQVCIRIVARRLDDLESIRNVLKTHYQSVEEGWKQYGSQLTLRVLIPTQAKPEGYRERDDVPSLSLIHI